MKRNTPCLLGQLFPWTIVAKTKNKVNTKMVMTPKTKTTQNLRKPSKMNKVSKMNTNEDEDDNFWMGKLYKVNTKAMVYQYNVYQKLISSC